MRVGVIGLGVMGRPMAERLLAAGHTVFVHNRTRDKAAPLLAQGAQWTDSPGQAAARSEVVISVVTDPAAVEEVSLGPEGILSALPPASVHCDMSTVSPAWAAQIAQTYRQQGRRFVQAPVLGSKRQIQEGTLLVFGGGAEVDVQACEPAWRAFAARIWHLPAADQASTAKLACNMLIAHMIVGLGQSLIFAKKGGVSPEVLLDILGASALAAPMYGSKGKTLLARDFDANFFVRHMLKDLSLIAETAGRTQTPLPLSAVTRELFVAAAQQGWGGEDYSAVVKVLEQLAGTELS